MKSLWIAFLAFAAFGGGAFVALAPESACADTWIPPETRVILSPNGHYRLTVEPAPPDNRFQNSVENELAKKLSPTGLLERKLADGEWEEVWTAALVNPIAPVTAAISDDGRYVVTFDNWGGVGRGDHVVVIYGARGEAVRSLRLNEILPDEYIAALSHSVSSTGWLDNYSMASGENRIELDVLVPNGERPIQAAETVRFGIDLKDGSVVPPPAKEWGDAQCAAERVMEERGGVIYVGQPGT